MSYIDETYGKQLEEALRGLVSRPALGQPWFGFHASEVPAGVLLFTATTHSRVLYADFWNYIQNKNLVKTEEEWQSIYSAQGWCPFYSDGDGIDTFRMPSPPLYIKGSDNTTVGQYVEAGLPNITGGLRMVNDYNFNNVGIVNQIWGAFTVNSVPSTIGANIQQNSTPSGDGVWPVTMDASRSSAVYGNSDTVTPETSKMLFGVWAISAPQQPIPDATVEGIISELGVASNSALEAKNVALSVVPAGTVIAFAANKTLDGFLLCNGAAVSRTTYAALFSAIGTTYGTGDGSTTFNLPNLTDKFIQGSGTAGTEKAAGLPNITGSFSDPLGSTNRGGVVTGYGAFKNSTNTADGDAGSGAYTNVKVQFNASTSNSIYGKSSTVQPPALTMRYYIKY